MGPVARAWLKAQDPDLVRAIRHAFCEHSRVGGSRGCRCLSKEDRAVLAGWVRRSVMRGYPNVVRVDRFGRIASARWGRPELMGEDGHYQAVKGCWFPFCRKPPGHTGQHSGSREAGARLVEIRTLAADLLVQEDTRVPFPEGVRVLLQLAAEAV